MKKKGSVLVQVLMTAVIVSIIAAGMMTLLLMRSQAIKRAQGTAAGTAMANGGLNAILSGWGAAGGVNCSAVTGYTMTGGSAGQCNCTYTAAAGAVAQSICAGSACNPAQSTNPCGIAIVAAPPQ